MNTRKVMPTTYLLVALLAILLLNFLMPIIRIIPSPWNAIGVIFLLAGLLINLRADRLFHRAGTTVKPHTESSVLVTGDVFRFSRNPMYLGFALLLTGVALLLGALTPFLVIPIFVALIEVIFIRAEEKMLAQTFGQVYLDYRKQVRRWL